MRWFLGVLAALVFFAGTGQATTIISSPVISPGASGDGSQGNPFGPTSMGSTMIFTLDFSPTGNYGGGAVYLDPPSGGFFVQDISGADLTGITIPAQSGLTPGETLTVTSSDGTNTLSVGGSALTLSPSVSPLTVTGFSNSDTVTASTFEFGLEFPIGLTGDDTIQLSAVPEPASLTLLGIGIAGMVGYDWRRRKLAAV